MKINPKPIFLISGVGLVVGAIFGLQPALITCGALMILVGIL